MHKVLDQDGGATGTLQSSGYRRHGTDQARSPEKLALRQRYLPFAEQE